MNEIMVRRLSETEFAALAPTNWNRLVATAKKPSIFCTYEWLSTWWSHYKSRYSFYFLSASCDGRIVGVLPLVKRFTTIEDALIPGRVLVYAGSNESASDHVDIIAEPIYANNVANAISCYLYENRKDWDLLHLSHVDVGGIWTGLSGNPQYDFQNDTRKLSCAPYLTIACDFDEFMRQTFRGKKRRQVSAIYRKVNASGMEIRECAIGEEERVIDALFTLHALRAQQKGIDSAFRGVSLKRFHTELASRLNRGGYLYTLYLEREEEILGVLYCFRFARTLFWYQIGLNPGFSKMSLGTALVYDLIRRGHQDSDVVEIDFLRGSGEHKTKWAKEARGLLGKNIYSRTRLGRLQRCGYRGRQTVVEVLRSLQAKWR